MEDRAHRLIVALCAALLLIVGVAGCGGSASHTVVIRPPGSLCVYAGLPLVGPEAAAGAEVLEGMRTALVDARSRAGRYGVKLCGVGDDSNGAGLDPALAAKAAQLAVARPRAVAYIGDLEGEGTDTAGELLSAAGLAQLALSPVAARVPGAGGVTGAPNGIERSGPPSTALQLVPDSQQQAEVAVAAVRAHGCLRVRTVSGGSGDGRQLAALVRAAASAGGLVDARNNPQCLIYTGNGATEPSSSQTPASNHITELATVTACNSAWARTLTLPATNTYLCIAPEAAAPSQLPEAYGEAAMELILDAVRRLGPSADSREAVLRALRSTRSINTAIGPLSFARDGTVVVTHFELYEVGAGGGLHALESLAG